MAWSVRDGTPDPEEHQAMHYMLLIYADERAIDSATREQTADRYGAYLAGLRGGYAYDTWPKMGDEWFPRGTPMMHPWLLNLVDNPIAVQFIHQYLSKV